MSYCRFSSDHFNCDLYCYESSEGFVTHVAAFRHRAWLRLLHFVTDKRVEYAPGKTFRVNRINTCFWPRKLTHKSIRSAYSGSHFIDETEEDMFARILHLHVLGFVVPKRLIAEARRSNLTP